MASELSSVDDSLPPSSGFQAYLENANLHNLLQVECLSRTTGVFRVVGDGAVGYLHLSDGQLIHAETELHTGEEAAMQILGWGSGQFGSCEEPLSVQRTVNVSLEGLLLTMAKQADETEYAHRRQVDTLPSGEVAAPASQQGSSQQAVPQHGLRRPVTGRHPIVGRGPAVPSERCIADLVLSKSGEVLQQRGAPLDDLPPRVAYAARLADLIGQAIGSGIPSSVTLKGQFSSTVICRLKDGNLVASLSERSAARG